MSKALGYRLIGFGGKRYYAHRLAWAYVYCDMPDGQIDHINHDRDDNRIANLRAVTDGENKQNKPKQANNTSGVVGVWSQRGKWVAEIKVRRQKHHLGVFDTLEEAAAVRAQARRELHPLGRPQ